MKYLAVASDARRSAGRAMFVIQTLVRLAAWLMGSFAVLSGLMDIMGFVPYSNQMPAWTSRLTSSLPVMVGGVILLIPMSRFLLGRRYALLALGYGALVLAAAIMAAQGILVYLGGGRHWAIVPSSLVLLSIPLANALLLWWSHRAAALRTSCPQ
ncbi:MAG TPA: hypothetical protein VGD45_15035 [Steroidobacter sp.]|uniref:hypothetical protein n=1 Tax=Steroidobacter sp. TaxID=1978227 RepID=UPI002ED7FDCA